MSSSRRMSAKSCVTLISLVRSQLRCMSYSAPSTANVAVTTDKGGYGADVRHVLLLPDMGGYCRYVPDVRKEQ